MAEELDMKFFAKLTWDDNLSPIHDKETVRRERKTGAATRLEFRELYGHDYMQGICNQLWDHPQINWDGKVLGCCRNFWGHFGGNAFTDGLIPSLNNEKITYARKMLRGEMPAREDIPCTTCEIYLHMCANNRWIKRENLGSAVTLTAEGARRNGDDTRVPGAERRNGLCRCGSGKRYKHCHGRFGDTASNVNFV